jgi:hypothetical protein
MFGAMVAMKHCGFVILSVVEGYPCASTTLSMTEHLVPRFIEFITFNVLNYFSGNVQLCGALDPL